MKSSITRSAVGLFTRAPVSDVSMAQALLTICMGAIWWIFKTGYRPRA